MIPKYVSVLLLNWSTSGDNADTNFQGQYGWFTILTSWDLRNLYWHASARKWQNGNGRRRRWFLEFLENGLNEPKSIKGQARKEGKKRTEVSVEGGVVELGCDKKRGWFFDQLSRCHILKVWATTKPEIFSIALIVCIYFYAVETQSVGPISKIFFLHIVGK